MASPKDEPESPVGAAGGGMAVPLVFMLIAAVLLFGGLGHYPLWDDEAQTALGAKGIMRTGDTSVVIDHNIVAYRNGLLLHNRFDRWTPPLASYLAAPFVGRDGTSAFMARLPMAACGLAAICLMLGWTRRCPRMTQVLLGLGILGNASLLLYLRQCRYYAPSILLSVAIAWVYLRGGRHRVAGLAALLVLLFAANPLTCAGLCLCLGVDYLVWGRRETRLSLRDWITMAAILLACCIPLAMTWNPFRTGFAEIRHARSLGGHFWLWKANWRDMNQCEFGSGLLLVATLAAGIAQRDAWVLRGSLALVLFVSVATVLSPQPELGGLADVRYLVATIPLFIAMGARGIGLLSRGRAWVALPLGLLAFGTNLFNGAPFLFSGVRCPLADYVGEIRHPPPDPYTAAIHWIRGTVRPGESILVTPGHMTYPLMFHAPWPVYAWQLTPGKVVPGLEGLPRIHYVGRSVPDYILIFGPTITQALPILASWSKVGLDYERVATLDTYYRDLYRPELLMRDSRPTVDYDRATEAIYAFRRITPVAP